MNKGQALKIGIITIQNAPWKELVKRWKFIDKTEIDSLWVADHFTHWNEKEMTFFECWTTLTGMACETSRVRVGTSVTNVRWRNPAWFAKQVLAVDHISNGRIDLGLGASGTGVLECAMTGHEVWSAKKRVEHFKEYVEIVDQLLRNPITTYKGKYYNLEGTIVLPSTVQKPRPPIYIGARGPKMLKITAKYADAWNILQGIENLEETAERIEERNKLLDEYCKEVGRDPSTLRRTLGIYEHEAMHHIGPMKLYQNHEILEDLVKMSVELGITEVYIPYPFVEEEIPSFEQISLEMVPELKKRYN